MKYHLKNVEEILSTLAIYNIKIELTKCEYFTQKVRYFGQILDPVKLSID